MDSDDDLDNVSIGMDDINIELTTDEYPFDVLSIEDVHQQMIESIDKVNAILKMPANTIRHLLHHFQWDKEKLMEKYYDMDDQELFFHQTNTINPFNSDEHKSNELESSESLDSSESSVREINFNIFICEKCYRKYTENLMSGLKCGHLFCKYCWNEYLTIKIMSNEFAAQSMVCAAHDCNILIDDAIAMELIVDVKTKQKYQQLLANEFVACNRLLRWCPSGNCSYAIQVSWIDAKSVTCKCGHTFCFECGANCHDPIACDLMKKFLKEYVKQSTDSTIVENANCYKCIASMGNYCNRSCAFDCICLEKWNTFVMSHDCRPRIDYENTDKYNNAISDNIRNPTRNHLYFNRYSNNMQSLEYEHNLYDLIPPKMNEIMQQQNMSWIEVQFLKKAIDILCQCRQTLMATYAFAYYLRENNQSLIFQNNQYDLELATDILAVYFIEILNNITVDNVIEIKQKVQDKYGYCEKRRKVLLDNVHEGFDKNWWFISG